MFLSLLALLLIIAPLVLLTRGCSFEPGAPRADPADAPVVDVRGDLSRLAPSVGFPIRLPRVPEQWRANSTSTSSVPPTSVVVRAGWLTPERFVQLSQSSAPMADLLAVETGTASSARGDVDVDGTKWAVHPGRRDERVWVADLAGTTVLITGNGSEDEFRTVARSLKAAPPLPTA